MTKIFKKTFAIFIAVIMMISSFPYMALAEDTASATEGSTPAEMTNAQLEEYIDSKIKNAKLILPEEQFVKTADKEFMSGIYTTTAKLNKNYSETKLKINDSTNARFATTELQYAVAVYTGENDDIRFPVIFAKYFYVENKNDRTPFYINYVSLPQNENAKNFEFILDWYRCQGITSLTSYDDPHPFSSKYNGTCLTGKAFRMNENKFWRNYIKYTGSGDEEKYYEALPTSLNIGFQYSNITVTGSLIYNPKSTAYVLNLKPYRIILENLNKEYTEIKKNKSLYTEKSLNNYYKAVRDVLDFDIKDLLSKMTSDSKAFNTEIANIATKVKTVVENYNLAKKINLDSTAYIAQKEQCDIIIKNQTANNEYDINSYTEFKKIYDDVIEKAKTVEDQKALDDLTAQLITAQSMLRKKSITITYRVIKDDKEETESEKQQSYSYGESVDYSYTCADGESIKAWTVKDETNHAYTRVGTSEANFSLVATRDLYVDVYVTTKQVSTAEYSKVTFIGPGGNIIDIKYVEKDKTLDKSQFPTAPEIPFYTFNNIWSQENVKGTGKDIEVYASYSVDSQKCRVHFNNNELLYDYDQLVKLEGYNSDNKYALAKDPEGKNIITYLDRDSFHAPRTDYIYVVEVSETKAKIGITGNFGDTDSEERKLATYNCKFYLPAGCTAVEWGLEINNGKTAKQAQSNVQNEYNEYSVTVRYKSTSTVKKITCRAYLTYKTSDQYVTIYSDPVEQAISTL